MAATRIRIAFVLDVFWMEVTDEDPIEAVIVGVCTLVTWMVVTMKFAVVDPGATVTLVGT